MSGDNTGDGISAPPIILSREPPDAEIRAAVAKWIEQMALGDYASAVAAVFRKPPAPDDFREQVEMFAAGYAAARRGLLDALRKQGLEVSDPSAVSDVPPPEVCRRGKVIRATAQVLEAMEIHRDSIPREAVAWLGFHVPLDNGFLIWTTMGVLRAGDRCVLEFEIFHL
jgi:hypothetical protein